jgi:putative transposase
MVTPAGKRKAVAHLVEAHGMSERRACKAIGCCRMTMRYQTTRADDAGLRQRMKAIPHERRRFGYRRLHVLLRREGRVVNHTRVFCASIGRSGWWCTADAKGPWERAPRCRFRRFRTTAGRWISSPISSCVAGAFVSSPISTIARANAWRPSPTSRFPARRWRANSIS